MRLPARHTSGADQSNRYEVRIVPRDGMGRTLNDWHATVTRRSDGAQLVFIAEWRWLLNLQCTRYHLDRSFRSLDQRRTKMARVSEFSR
jgi:hypothetical protein